MLVQAPWLRIVHVNEGAQLSSNELAVLKTIIKRGKSQTADGSISNNNSNKVSSRKLPHRTVVSLGGNFLGPSLISSLDQGTSLIDAWNQVGVTHVGCLGTHEANAVHATTLSRRMDQSKFVWLNSNMTDLNCQLSYKPTQEYDVIEIWNGRIRKRVGLMGLIGDDPGLYSPGGIVASGSPTEPVGQTALSLTLSMQGKGDESIIHYNPKRKSKSRSRSRNRHDDDIDDDDDMEMRNQPRRRRGRAAQLARSLSNKSLRDSGSGKSQKSQSLDLIIPFTFQSMPDNRRLAQILGNQKNSSAQLFPLIVCGGDGSIGEDPSDRQKNDQGHQSNNNVHRSGGKRRGRQGGSSSRRSSSSSSSTIPSLPESSSSSSSLSSSVSSPLPLPPAHETMDNGIQLVRPSPMSVAVIDIVWKPTRNKPSVSVQMVPLTPDAALAMDDGPSVLAAPNAEVLERIRAYERLYLKPFLPTFLVPQSAKLVSSASSSIQRDENMKQQQMPQNGQMSLGRTTSKQDPEQRLFRTDRWLNQARFCRALNIDRRKSDDATKGKKVTPLTLSTMFNKAQMNTGSTALATLMRLGWGGPTTTPGTLSLSTVLLPADAVVGNTNYNRISGNGGDWFTWQDLQREMPQPLSLMLADVPGSVLFDTVNLSRQIQPKLPPKQRERHERMKHYRKVSFLHTCTNVEYNSSNPAVMERINGEPLDPDREYLIAFPIEFIDPNTSAYPPLLKWARDNPTSVLRKEAAQRSDLLIAQALSSVIWFLPGSFLDLRNQGGMIVKEQIRRIVKKRLARRINVLVQEEDVIDIVVDNVLISFDNSHGASNRGVEGDVINTIDIMTADPIVQDAIVIRQDEDEYYMRDEEQRRREENKVLRDCAADFAGGRLHSDQLNDSVAQFRSIVLSEDETERSDSYSPNEKTYSDNGKSLYGIPGTPQHYSDDQQQYEEFSSKLHDRLTLRTMV